MSDDHYDDYCIAMAERDEARDEVERLRGLLRYAARHIPSASGARMYVIARIDGDPTSTTQQNGVNG